MMAVSPWKFRRPLGLQIFAYFLTLILSASAQDCSRENPCATGCCSQHGYCGTGDEFCGEGCVDTCDYKMECDANNPCASGCCNKFGFCGLGPDYCGDDCISSCDSKAYCDPGFGAEWAEVSSCPLNVCCSKFGFCGTTEEFCGDKKVKRPSCPSTNDLKRVVGYYETWASRRQCNQFWPERIPLGVYTHIIIAFANIDPETFEIQPAVKADIDLYNRVAFLKTMDPALKVFIAVGGWSFNDPGPTATTFSDLAASETNQKAFFKSLIRFLSTYNLDGIDFDWEYPVADDRSGRPVDFRNFPKLLKNLKAALKATGGRDGLSITLPASYWYLQHFDIKNMVKHVDFFNIMSYDLHGTWDKGNEWVGEYLNAHTNLTEITTALDLLWRNNISPQQVVLGLAFYARAFTLVDPACTKPGCLFASGAEAGECSNEVGILMNSEIDKIITGKGLTWTMYKKEAVKIVHWDDQWAAYDDGDTWKIKTDFARGQCLGGVMVWAISHDTLNGTYSKDLASVVGRKFQSLPATMEEEETYTVKNEQCKWTNCGTAWTCPNGWTLMRRTDPGAADDEWMTDDTGCHIKGERHLLCCPPDKETPSCGWWTHNNGDCEGKCPDGMFEIGGNNLHCSTAFGNYQAACCSSGSKNVALYDKCAWGASFDCDDYQCSAVMSNITAYSCNGNGGSACAGDWRTHENEQRKFCCDTQDDNMRWDDCTWEDDYTDDGLISVEKGSKSIPCISNCPDDKVRIAMEKDGVCKKPKGSRAKCCSPNYTTKKDNPLKAKWASDLKDWMDDGICRPAHSTSPLESRSILDWAFTGNTSQFAAANDVAEHLSRLKKRQTQDIMVPGTSNHSRRVLITIIFASQSGTWSSQAKMALEVWNNVVPTVYKHLGALVLMKVLQDVVRQLTSTGAATLADDILCNMPYWDDLVRVCSLPQFNDMTCENIPRAEWDPEYNIDPDSYGTSNPSIARRNVGHSLDKRDGAERPFTIDCGIDSATGLRRVLTVWSQRYPNGDGGNALERANGITVRFALANIDDCYDTTIDPNAPNNLWQWVTEHILELQLIPRSIEFMVTGVIPAVQKLSAYEARNSPLLPWDVTDWLTSDYQTWANGLTNLKGAPIDRIFNALGSRENPHDLRNAEYHLNSMKGRLFEGKQPIGDDYWQLMLFPQELSADVALDEIRMVISVFQYLNDVDVNGAMRSSFGNVMQEWVNFDGVVKQKRGTATRGATLWREYLMVFMERMVTWARSWLTDRLDELDEVWTGVRNLAPDQATYQLADVTIIQIALLRAAVNDFVNFDTSIFLFPS
ncbi:glycoside hydrolase family 18 protein [Aspergillus heterothallicus]